MGNDELNQIKDQYSNIQNELARLNESIEDIKTRLEQDRKISRSRWVSNTGYMVVGLGIGVLGISVTRAGSATTIISGICLIIFGMALQPVSTWLYPKRTRKTKFRKPISGTQSMPVKLRDMAVFGTILVALLLASRKPKVHR